MNLDESGDRWTGAFSGLVLADGWHGRPFDSLFALASAVDLPDGLKSEIEGGWDLICEGNVTIVKTGFEKYPALRIEGFKSASWNPHVGVVDRQTYGESGGVVLVS
ncbi:hypothetical protein QK292_18040 [Arthrobacter sp. AL08]|uniref:hypothetical protein n=1 Tax=Micrococcaceae TaxID=1268 RepID=UPI001CFFB62D|nr:MULTISPECIES: hypothetical protein [Micrococcaceae]MDI3243439.1 hypothetical protein [Arthrobacter sp. AL05]MDI3279449.1 hypothetical protein [Arthrobacter sp. AL08]MDJ0354489.1 hypothetical protein [Pseudarthrobacter sp. PH31-O2]WGZ80865.1 hypothetical protein QI450_06735 [Arthrobacter sp. EM1]